MARIASKKTVKISIQTVSNKELIKAVRTARAASIRAFNREMSQMDKAIVTLKTLDKGLKVARKGK